MRCLYYTVHKTLTHEAVTQNGAFPPTATIFAFYPFFLSTTVQRCLQFSSMPRPLRLQWTKPTHHPAINYQNKSWNTVITIPHGTNEPIPSCFAQAHILSAWDVVAIKLCIHGYYSVYLFILFCLLVCGYGYIVFYWCVVILSVVLSLAVCVWFLCFSWH